MWSVRCEGWDVRCLCLITQLYASLFSQAFSQVNKILFAFAQTFICEGNFVVMCKSNLNVISVYDNYLTLIRLLFINRNYWCHFSRGNYSWITDISIFHGYVSNSSLKCLLSDYCILHHLTKWVGYIYKYFHYFFCYSSAIFLLENQGKWQQTIPDNI